jgi:hypothetical protein
MSHSEPSQQMLDLKDKAGRTSRRGAKMKEAKEWTAKGLGGRRLV